MKSKQIKAFLLLIIFFNTIIYSYVVIFNLFNLIIIYFVTNTSLLVIFAYHYLQYNKKVIDVMEKMEELENEKKE